MPRRRVVERREPPPDPVYSSSLISRFINNLMHEGKKSVAERMFYGSLTIVEDKLKQDGLSVLKLALEIIAASKGEGSAVKKREDTHKMAEANKAFAHYRW